MATTRERIGIDWTAIDGWTVPAWRYDVRLPDDSILTEYALDKPVGPAEAVTLKLREFESLERVRGGYDDGLVVYVVVDPTTVGGRQARIEVTLSDAVARGYAVVAG